MQIDWWTLAIQTINFLVVVWLLTRFLYQPIRRAIEEREAADRAAAEAAEEKSRAADEARRTYEEKRAELADAQRREEAALHTEMEKAREEMLDAAEKQAREIVEDARTSVAREREQALKTLSGEISGLARDLARKALGDADTLTGDGLLKRVTAHLDALPQSDLADLRADLSEKKARFVVVSASPLAQDMQKQWEAAMAERFANAAVDFASDPDILGGADLRFPHAVLSFSVAGRLGRAVKDLEA